MTLDILNDGGYRGFYTLYRFAFLMIQKHLISDHAKTFERYQKVMSRMTKWDQNFLVGGQSKWSMVQRNATLSRSEFFKLVTDRNKKILDLGCGYGKSLGYLSSRGYTNLHGVDPNKDLLSRVPQRVAQVKPGTAERIPHENETFDVVFINGVLHHIHGRENYFLACGETDRVLKPGGFVIIMEPGGGRVTWKSITLGFKVLGFISKTARALYGNLSEEKEDFYYFLREHSYFRKYFLAKNYKVICDKYFFAFWIFTIEKRVNRQ